MLMSYSDVGFEGESPTLTVQTFRAVGEEGFKLFCV